MVPFDALASSQFGYVQHHQTLAGLDFIQPSEPRSLDTSASKDGFSLQHLTSGYTQDEDLVLFDAAQSSPTPEAVAALSIIPFQAADESGNELAQIQPLLNGPPLAEDATWSFGPTRGPFQYETMAPTASWSVPNTAIFRAVRNGHENIVRFFVNSRADLSKRDDKGRTVIHFAIECRRFSITKILLEDLEDKSLLNSQDSNGSTPLHIAIHAGDVDTAKLLLQLGVDAHITNNDGDGALDSAIDAGSLLLVQLLVLYRV